MEKSKINKNIPGQLFSGEAILEGMPEIAYVFDQEGRLIKWNKNAELVLGYSNEELNLKFVGDFIDKPYRKEVLEIFSKAFDDKVDISIEYDMLTKSEEKIPHIGSGSLSIIDGNEYLIGQAINISKLKTLEKKLNLQIKEINHLKDQIQMENISLKKEIIHRHNHKEIIGKSDLLLNALDLVEKVAPLDISILLEGEARTGKELFARAIHNLSKRKENSFIKVNCSTTPSQKLEIELFGKDKDVYTKGSQKQIGKLELTNKGTIFLDKIEKLPVPLQAKLLNVIQKGEFVRLNGVKPISVSVRFIVASDQNLELCVRKHLFKKDLYYLLKVYPIIIPPLRERKIDIPLLSEHFMHFYNTKHGKKVTKITKKDLQQMLLYSWPGNLMELKNVIERAVINSPAKILKINLIKAFEVESEDRYLSLSEIEKIHILRVLKKTNWRVDGPKGAALILDIHPETLRSRMRKLKINRPKK